MARSLKVEVEPHIFKWLRESSGWSKEEVAKKLDTSVDVIEAIEKGERKPTLRQLKELSNAYKRPLASFLLSEPLKEAPMPKDYRMLPGRNNVFDRKTIHVIRKARGLQEVGKELLINFNDTAKPKVTNHRISDNPEAIALKYRETVNLTPEKQRKFKTHYEFYGYLRDVFEEMNILVFQFSMPIEDARGFALTDDTPNVIVINSADAIEARVFSLMHEFGHVLLGDTAIDLPHFSYTPDHRVEKWCNTFASEFLVPKALVKADFTAAGDAITDSSTLIKLSRKYNVSKGMLSYKMFKMDFISKEEYEEILDRYKPSEPEPQLDDEEDEKKDGGIPADIKCLSAVGHKFVSMVAENYDRNFITYTDALNYLSIRSRHFDQVLAKAKQ